MRHLPEYLLTYHHL
jgi:serine/threonine-protein phosphatase PP1 catalytic subunit